MAKQDTNRRDDNAEPLKLHSHRALDDTGVPAMTRAMEARLCQPHERIERPGDLPAPLALPAAWARLQAQEPRLARTVAATVMQGQSTRAAAPALGRCYKTVATDKGAGMAQLQVWTGLPSYEVARQLRDLGAPQQSSLMQCGSKPAWPLYACMGTLLWCTHVTRVAS